MDIKKFFRRLGCGFLLFVWFLFVLTPCLVITLAMQGEIAINYSDIPEDQFRVWSVQNRDLRGLGFANSRRVTPADPSDAVCTIIDVHFLFWYRSDDSDEQWTAHRCSCYQRENQQWTSIAEGADACQMAGEEVPE